MATPQATAIGRRCRLTIAPRPPASPAREGSLLVGDSSGSRFSCLRSDSDGSDEGESVSVDVALRALDEEVRGDVGWTPVTRRRRKSKADAVNDFWREIGYPTPLSRPWERARRGRSSAGESTLFCRSVDVYAAGDGSCDAVDGSPDNSPLVGSEGRVAASSPSRLRLSRGPRMGPWRGPLPRRRVTPPPVLG
jgi:hypothetical protein